MPWHINDFPLATLTSNRLIGAMGNCNMLAILSLIKLCVEPLSIKTHHSLFYELSIRKKHATKFRVVLQRRRLHHFPHNSRHMLPKRVAEVFCINVQERIFHHS
ncbi:hypothetical protein MANES_01G059525v8 [Manihot esculenta]|uniref:Uncharacterized protein n=1 Tax=Manihot esculenta TaxID=3983 RepID=A0ACB7ICB5_MANES|nr:hypothetical protein MANES_01G059525v8 [Manihot esculenta]